MELALVNRKLDASFNPHTLTSNRAAKWLWFCISPSCGNARHAGAGRVGGGSDAEPVIAGNPLLLAKGIPRLLVCHLDRARAFGDAWAEDGQDFRWLAADGE
jgi:hypothetical protein